VLEQQCSDLGRSLAEACPAGVGFTLFLFDFHEGGNLAYFSNAQREDMIKAVAEWLERQRAAHP
jgi:hypothetical protein